MDSGARTPFSLYRIALIGLLSLGVLGADCDDSAGPAGPIGPEWELWPSRTSIPNLETEVVILPNLHPDSPPIGFPPAGVTVQHDGVEWAGLQWGRDVRIAKTVPANTWLFGPLGDFWWKNSVNPVAQLRATRLVAIEVDGERIPVTVDDIYAFGSDDFDAAMYAIFVRFTTPGLHSLKYIWRQEAYFFFHFRHDLLGDFFPDPWPEFQQRRVFVPETVGDQPLDGQTVWSYTLNVVEE